MGGGGESDVEIALRIWPGLAVMVEGGAVRVEVG